MSVCLSVSLFLPFSGRKLVREGVGYREASACKKEKNCLWQRGRGGGAGDPRRRCGHQERKYEMRGVHSGEIGTR